MAGIPADGGAMASFSAGWAEVEHTMLGLEFPTTGARIRQVPFTPQRIKTALAAMRH